MYADVWQAWVEDAFQEIPELTVADPQSEAWYELQGEEQTGAPRLGAEYPGERDPNRADEPSRQAPHGKASTTTEGDEGGSPGPRAQGTTATRVGLLPPFLSSPLDREARRACHLHMMGMEPEHTVGGAYKTPRKLDPLEQELYDALGEGDYRC